MYKSVGTSAFDPDRRKANFDLLGAGTLYVAKFNDDGTGQWRPLVFGQERLTRANGTCFAGADPSLVSPISSSDNITFDGEGNCAPPMVSPSTLQSTMASMRSLWMGASEVLCASSSVVQRVVSSLAPNSPLTSRLSSVPFSTLVRAAALNGPPAPGRTARRRRGQASSQR